MKRRIAALLLAALSLLSLSGCANWDEGTYSNDPLGELAAARAGAGAANADPFTYFVQAGAFRGQEDADAQRARLSLMGVEARVSEREQAGRTVYRVRVGPFQNRDAADRVKARLDDNGFDAALVRVQK